MIIRRPPPFLTAALLTVSTWAMAPSLAAQGAPPAAGTGTPASGAPAAGAAAAGTPATGSPAAAAPVRSSWVSDKRDYAVGDLITVLIDDYTISTAIKEDVATDTRTRGLSLNANLPAGSKSVGIDSRNGADQTKRGQARRENRFQNEMSVRVVAIGPNGLLQVKGTKKIDVDKAQQDIVFTGFVRPQDITAANSVESTRVADIAIGYVSPGPLGKPKQGILTKILGGLWP